MIGKMLGHYQITGQLGKGGMGEVFQAKDQIPCRDVLRKKKHFTLSSIKLHFAPFLITLTFLVGSPALGEQWDDISYTTWSAAQVDEVLNNSPWVRSVSGAPPVTSLWPRRVTYAPLLYHVRLLTARPVREGFLRMVSLGMGCDTVDIKELDEETRAEYRGVLLQDFLRSYSKAVRAKGDGQHIILAVTLKEYDYYTGEYLERINGDKLSNIDISRIKVESSLSTNTGKQVDLLRYIKPGRDRVGTRFCFPRNLADGTSLITAEDKELFFETRVNDSKIRVKFDLRKMLYKGKVEF